VGILGKPGPENVQRVLYDGKGTNGLGLGEEVTFPAHGTDRLNANLSLGSDGGRDERKEQTSGGPTFRYYTLMQSSGESLIPTSVHLYEERRGSGSPRGRNAKTLGQGRGSTIYLWCFSPGRKGKKILGSHS